MKTVQLLFILLCIYSCSQNANEIQTFVKKGYFIDSTYKFKDSAKERIILSRTPAKDSLSQYINFEHYYNINHKWELKSQFDSIQIHYNFFTEHKDFNGDKVNDFVFLSKLGSNDENVFYNLIIYDTLNKKFELIKGFNKICNPNYDNRSKNIYGAVMLSEGGGDVDKNCYQITKDSVVQIDGEIRRNLKFVKNYKVEN